MNFSSPFARDLVTYCIGYILALMFTFGSFAIVYYNLMPPFAGFLLMLSIGVLQVIVHLRCFLHLTPDRSAREDLHLVFFSVQVIGLMLMGTLVIIFDLKTRM